MFSSINRKKLIINIIKVLFTCLFVFALYNIVDLEKIIQLVKKIDLYTFVYGFFVYSSLCFLRTWRFVILLPSKVNKTNTFFIVALHSFFNRIMPFRLGESVYPYYMKQVESISYTESIVSLLVSRVFDLFSTMVVLIFAAVFILNNPLLTVFMSVVFFAGMAALFKARFLLDFFSCKLGARFKRLKPAADYMQNIADKYGSLLNYKKTALILVISLLIWFILFYFFAIFITVFGMDIPFMEIVLAGTFSNISSVLPITAFGNFGSMELGWTGALISRGIDGEQAFSTGFLANMLTFVDTTILAVFAFICLKINKLRKKG